MPKPNTKFDLSVDDLEVIETALTAALAEDGPAEIDPRQAHELLGRLHNQKVFYRPRGKAYISG
ncbi:MAG: hypothetical protein AAGF88_13710 [Pseudomonadota bacterium]